MAGQPVGMDTKEWTVRIQVTEDGDDTSARAALSSDDGAELTGIGRARRNPSDPPAPEIGDELAVSRALADLADKLAVTAQHDIAGSVNSPSSSRSW